jgi:hypothetical protein
VGGPPVGGYAPPPPPRTAGERAGRSDDNGVPERAYDLSE